MAALITTPSLIDDPAADRFDFAPAPQHAPTVSGFKFFSPSGVYTASSPSYWYGTTGNDKRVTNDPMEATKLGFEAWVKAVEKAGSTDTDKVLDAIVGVEVPNLTGGVAKVLPNHHLTKPVLIGEIRDDGQFDIVSQTEPVAGDAWTDFLPESAKLDSDWPGKQCGMWNTETNACVQGKSNY